MSPHHHGARLPPLPRACPNREHHPSFSAALLDAIYNSLDADGARTPTDPGRAPVSPAERSPRPPGRHRPSTTLSPSVSSVRSPRLQRTPRPCRVRPDPHPSLLLPPPPPGDSAEKKRNKRKKATSATFACLLDALLCNRKSAKPVETTTTARAIPAVTAEPASARSILSSRASRRESAAGAGGFLTPGRRAVRFSPAVTVVVNEEHGRGEGSARLRDTERMEVAAAQESAAEADRRVEELLRVLRVAEEKERAKESSEFSSDLFELESLAALEDNTELPRTRAACTAGMARPRPRVLVEEMIV